MQDSMQVANPTLTMIPDEKSTASGSFRHAFWNGLMQESANSLEESQGSRGSIGSASDDGPGSQADSNPSQSPKQPAPPTADAEQQRQLQQPLERREQQQHQQSRSVVFAPNVRVKVTIARFQMTAKELDVVWTTVADRRRNQADIIETVKAMRLAPDSVVTDMDTNEFCTRGLEHMHSADSYAKKKKNRENVLHAVFQEQERQWLEDLHCSKELAQASGTNSEWAKQVALQHAECDERYVVARRRSSTLRSLANVSVTSANGSKPVRGRRSSRVSFEQHGDQVLDEILQAAEESEMENPEGRRRSLETTGSEDDEDDGDEPVCVIPDVVSRIDGRIIKEEIEAGRMVTDDDDNDEIDLFNLDGSENSADFNPPLSDGGASRRFHASFARTDSVNLATILDDYYSSSGDESDDHGGGGIRQSCVIEDEECGTDDDTPLLRYLGDGPLSSVDQRRSTRRKGRCRTKRNMTPPIQPGGSGAGKGVLGIEPNGKESFMAAFRRSHAVPKKPAS